MPLSAQAMPLSAVSRGTGKTYLPTYLLVIYKLKSWPPRVIFKIKLRRRLLPAAFHQGRSYHRT